MILAETELDTPTLSTSTTLIYEQKKPRVPSCSRPLDFRVMLLTKMISIKNLNRRLLYLAKKTELL